jgi:transposase
LLLDDGMSCSQIAKVFFDDGTVRSWHKQYLAENREAVAYDGWKGGQSRMTPAQEADLSAWLAERFCRSTVQIRAYMGAKFGIRYSRSGCIKLLARLGFEYRKPKALPSVADVEKQAAFIVFYENLLNNLPADEAVYFADAVHPEYQSKPSYPDDIWARAREHSRGSEP